MTDTADTTPAVAALSPAEVPAARYKLSQLRFDERMKSPDDAGDRRARIRALEAALAPHDGEFPTEELVDLEYEYSAIRRPSGYIAILDVDGEEIGSLPDIQCATAALAFVAGFIAGDEKGYRRGRADLAGDLRRLLGVAAVEEPTR